MTFEEGEKLLKEMDITTKELDEMWNTCVLVGHPLISKIDKSGKNWRDMNTSAIKTLPKEYNSWKDGN